MTDSPHARDDLRKEHDTLKRMHKVIVKDLKGEIMKILTNMVRTEQAIEALNKQLALGMNGS